jgi:hypothetical protein
MRARTFSLLLLVACKAPKDPPAASARADAPSATAGPAASGAATRIDPTPAGWQRLDVDLPWKTLPSADGQRRTGTAALSVMAPAGTRVAEGLIVLPDHVRVYLEHEMDSFDPTEDRIVPYEHRTLASADCTARVQASGELGPWPGKPVDGAPAGVKVCVGPGWDPEAPTPGCHVVEGFSKDARVDCGGGNSCADEATALTVARVCASLRPR